jgi:hypothetical protein
MGVWRLLPEPFVQVVQMGHGLPVKPEVQVEAARGQMQQAVPVKQAVWAQVEQGVQEEQTVQEGQTAQEGQAARVQMAQAAAVEQIVRAEQAWEVLKLHLPLADRRRLESPPAVIAACHFRLDFSAAREVCSGRFPHS